MSNKSFDVAIQPDFPGSSTYFLSVTHNGLSWSSIRLDDPNYEVPRIIAKLQRFLDERQQEKRE